MRESYLGFQPINVVLAMYYPKTKPLIDPFSYFFGRWRASRRSVRRKNLREWLQFESSEKQFTPVFPDKYVSLSGSSERIKVSQISSTQLEEKFVEWIHSRYETKNLWTVGGDKAFMATEGNFPHEGEIRLSGRVRIKGRVLSKRKEDQPGELRSKFHDVTIVGPFNTSKEPLSSVSCKCVEHSNIANKFGYESASYVCPEIGAFSYFARYSPGIVSNLEGVLARREPGTRIWLPFHPRDPQEITGDYYIQKQGSQPRLSNLMVSSILAYLSSPRDNKAAINKRLKRLEVIYDPLTKKMIQEERAGWEVIPKDWIWLEPNKLSRPLVGWKNDLVRMLSLQKYEFKALVYEKEGTENEVTAMEYTARNDNNRSVRLLFFNGLPPLVLERIVLPREQVDLFALERKSYVALRPTHVYQELYDPKLSYDNRRCRFTMSEVRLAHEAWNPQEMLPDYHESFRKFFGDNAIPVLRRRLFTRQKSLQSLGIKSDYLDKERTLRLINTIAKYGR